MAIVVTDAPEVTTIEEAWQLFCETMLPSMFERPIEEMDPIYIDNLRIALAMGAKSMAACLVNSGNQKQNVADALQRLCNEADAIVKPLLRVDH